MVTVFLPVFDASVMIFIIIFLIWVGYPFLLFLRKTDLVNTLVEEVSVKEFLIPTMKVCWFFFVNSGI